MKQAIKELINVFLIISGIAFWIFVFCFWGGVIHPSQPPATATGAECHSPYIFSHDGKCFDSYSHGTMTVDKYTTGTFNLYPGTDYDITIYSDLLPTSTDSGQGIPYDTSFSADNFIGAPGNIESQTESAWQASKGTPCDTIINGIETVHDMSWNGTQWNCAAPTSAPQGLVTGCPPNGTTDCPHYENAAPQVRTWSCKFPITGVILRGNSSTPPPILWNLVKTTGTSTPQNLGYSDCSLIN